jgi:hypothetical protein
MLRIVLTAIGYGLGQTGSTITIFITLWNRSMQLLSLKRS